MNLEEMVQLIRQEWSDAMSDAGAIWEKTSAMLTKAKASQPDLYAKALPIARERGML